MKREEIIVQPAQDAHTLLLINGEDGIYDSSMYAHAITNQNVTIQDNSMYFGGNAMLNTDIGDKKITNGVFTFECWVKLANTQKQYKAIADFCNHSTMYFDASDSYYGTLILINGQYSWQSRESIMYNWSVLLTTSWQHFAIVGMGNQNRFYINGQMQTGGYFDTCINNLNMANGKVRIGNINLSGYTRYFRGWMKNIRLSNVARYTQNFPITM